MREIKFRVWDKQEKRMYDDLRSDITLICDYESARLVFGDDFHDDFSVYSTNKIELMQFTGLKDMTGKDIFEGDIIRGSYDQYGDKIEQTREVKYDEQMQLMPFHDIVGYDCELWMDEATYEVIGNVYENPDLLKEGKSE